MDDVLAFCKGVAQWAKENLATAKMHPHASTCIQMHPMHPQHASNASTKTK